MVFDFLLYLAVCFLVTSPLIGRKILDFLERKRFERMVDRVAR